MRLLCAVSMLTMGLAVLVSQAGAEPAAIHDGSKVSFDYVLVVEGKIADSSQTRGPLEYTQGDNTLIPGLTKQMQGMKPGEEKTIEVKPEEAYGNPDPEGIREIPLSSVPKDMKPEVGMVLQMEDQARQTFPARIIELKKDSIVIDLNHPLSGKTLIFKVKVVSIS